MTPSSKLFVLSLVLTAVLVDQAQCFPSITLLPSKCGTTEGPSPGQIIYSSSTSNYTDPLNCSFTITATSSSHRIRFSFNTGYGDVGIISNTNGTGCSGASLEIFDGSSVSSASITGALCGNLTSTERLSTGNTLTMLLLSRGGNETTLNFTAHYTSFTEASDCGNDFKCGNGRCVSPTTKCDSTLIDNCGDFSDNSPGPPANCTSETTTSATTVMTTNQTVTAPTTATAATNDQESNSQIAIYVAAAVGGLAFLYFLNWLLFRPGWLVWRMGCFRHMRSCRNCHFGGSSKNSVEAVKPLTSSMNNINSKQSDKFYSETPTSTRSVMTRSQPVPFSSSVFQQGIKKEEHIFSLNK